MNCRWCGPRTARGHRGDAATPTAVDVRNANDGAAASATNAGGRGCRRRRRGKARGRGKSFRAKPPPSGTGTESTQTLLAGRALQTLAAVGSVAVVAAADLILEAAVTQ